MLNADVDKFIDHSTIVIHRMEIHINGGEYRQELANSTGESFTI